MEAALGLAQLEDWQPVINQRRRNAALLSECLQKFDNHMQLPQIRPGSEHSFMMYPILLRNQAKQHLVNFLEESGIETREMLPLTNQPIYERQLGWREDDFPIAKWINESGFYVGCHQNLSDIDLEYMIETIERFFRGTRSQIFEGVTLALLADKDTEATTNVLGAIATDLFSQTLIVDAGMRTSTKTELARHGFQIVESVGRDPLTAVVEMRDQLKFDAVVLFPLNGQWDPNDISRLVMVLNRGYDMVIASRFVAGGERQSRRGRVRSFGNRVFNLAANLIFLGNISDGFSSFRAVRGSRLTSVQLSGRGLVRFFALSIAAMKGNWRI